MTFKMHMPIYVQIMDGVKMDIMKGILQPGDQLPSVRDLAAKLAVNPNTVQKAYQELEREGLCDSMRGLGRFIIEDDELTLRLRKQYMADQTQTYLQSMYDVGLTAKEIFQYMDTFKEEI